MINISIDGSAIKIVFEDSSRYLYGDGVITAPINSLSLILDNSDLITLTKSSNNDPFVSFLVAESNFASKEEFATWFKSNAVSAGGGGGSGSGVTSGQVESMISEALEDYPTNDDVDETLEDYYTKDEVDAGFSSVTSSVTAVNASLTAHTADTAIHTTSAEKAAWNAKQTALTAGTGIDISNNVISVTGGTDTGTVQTMIEDYFDPKEEVISTALNDLNDRMDDKQDALEAGTGIDITNNVISVTASTGGSNVIELTQAQYDALVDKDPDAMYVITDAPEINISGYAQSSAVTAVNDALTAHTANTTVHTTSAEKTTWNGKQDALVSGTNIKTINNQSLLGSGNIDIQGGGGGGISSAQCQTMIEDYCDPKEEVVATALNDLNGRVEHLETGGTGVTIATAITSSSTNDEAAGALATYNAITAATTGGGATYSAGTNISIDTANTINCTLPFIKVGNSNIKQESNTSIGSSAGLCSSFGSSNTVKNQIYNAFVAGYNLRVNRNYETAFGHFNKSYTGTSNITSAQTLFSVGNGQYHAEHNAFDVRENGDIYVYDGTNDVRLQDTILALGGLKFVKLTQSEYDQLATKDANTLYIITNVVS